MPWTISRNAGCPIMRPYAVLKDSDNSLVACHDTEAQAKAHIIALYAAEEDKGMKQ